MNHPVKTHGLTIYQAGFGDGGSPLSFDLWALPDPNPKPVTLTVRSRGDADIPLGNQSYHLSFSEFKATNIMGNEENPDEKPHNVGATITYTIAATYNSSKPRDRKSTRLNSSHIATSRMPSSA